MDESIVRALDAPDRAARLEAVRALGPRAWEGVERTEEVNNHVHSIYSFSPYSPARIAVEAARAGLSTVGIMDHDSVSGCDEFREACRAVAIAGTSGFEMRVNMDGTAVEGRKTNNPDEPNVSYIAVHGIPPSRLARCAEFLRPIHDARIERDRREVERLNALLAERGAPTLDFERDVLAVSRADEGGSVTERHILYALSLKLIELKGRGAPLVEYVEEVLRIPVAGRVREYLLDAENPHYAYDLLGVFKASLVPAFFIRSGKEECINVREAVAFANEIGAVPAYAYLGDVGESPTGDKRPEKFEDDFLDELIPELKRLGFKAVTYMPPRNTREQLLRLQRLCREHDLMEISGVDVNSSRQSFNCPLLLDPDFRHLTDAAWALVAHEVLAEKDPRLALFHSDNPLAELPLPERIARYAALGREMDPADPAGTIALPTL